MMRRLARELAFSIAGGMLVACAAGVAIMTTVFVGGVDGEPEAAAGERSSDFRHGYNMANADALLVTAVRTRRIAEVLRESEAAEIRRMVDGSEYVHIAALEDR